MDGRNGRDTLEVEAVPRALPTTLNASACDHPFLGAAVRRAKPLEQFPDFRRTDHPGRTALALRRCSFLVLRSQSRSTFSCVITWVLSLRTGTQAASSRTSPHRGDFGRAIERAVHFDRIELCRVIGKIIGRLHACRVEGALPARRSES
jgi:hypothetical protein